MAKPQNFQWILEKQEESSEALKSFEPSVKARYGWALVPLIIVLLCIYLIFFQQKPAMPAFSPRKIEVLRALTHIPKGKTIDPHYFQLVPVAANDFSKAQLLNLVHEEDLLRVKSKVKAKKDIHPGQTLDWKSIQFFEPSPIPPTKIYVSEDL